MAEHKFQAGVDVRAENSGFGFFGRNTVNLLKFEFLRAEFICFQGGVGSAHDFTV